MDNTTIDGITSHNMTNAKQVSSTSSLDSSATGSSNISYTIRNSPLNDQAQTLIGQPSAIQPTLPSALPQIISSTEDTSSNTNDNLLNSNVNTLDSTSNSGVNHVANGIHFNYSIGRGSNVIVSPPIPPPTTDIETSIAANNSVPEFLYQLTKMLTDDHRDIIEWSNGKIEVHNPHKLESDILNKYFRHSKYASFQRQLNYFGFRKLAGKGKMAPCSYVNENATHDLRSLLKMKRKTSATTKDNKGDAEGSNDSKSSKSKSSSSRVVNPVLSGSSSTTSGTKRGRNSSNGMGFGPTAKIAVGKGVKHQLNGYLKPSAVPSSSTSTLAVNNPLLSDTSTQNTESTNAPYNPHSIAKSAVGKGVCHQFTYTSQQLPTFPADAEASVKDPTKETSASSTFTFLDPVQLGMGIESSLSELKNNFRNSLNDAERQDQDVGDHMKRESSLVNLAMIPEMSILTSDENSDQRQSNLSPSNLFTFIDFPHELEPNKR